MLRPLLAALCAAVSIAAVPTGSAAAGPAPSTRAEAVAALTHGDAPERAAGVVRLGQLGTMADAPRLVERLRDADEGVRELATAALWNLWSRSGDAAIDRLFAQGVEQIGAGRLPQALATFTRIVQRKPAFAEGWNKRATVLFLMGRDEASLKDCAQVLQRNPLHFGALSGMAQIHWRRGDPAAALRAYERALEVNPNLVDGPDTLRLLEEVARRRGGERT